MKIVVKSPDTTDGGYNNADVLPVSFDFTLTVACEVTSFTLSTTVTDFDYILNSDQISKGPITPVQVTDCKWPVTFSVERFVGGVSQGDATSLFDSESYIFTYQQTDVSMIDTV